MEKIKILVTAVNAKYIHSNLAIYSLRANAGEYKKYVELAEFSINHRTEEIIKGIYKRKPDILCFSCYIWNISIIKAVARELRKVLPDTKIWLGGPEVSYNIESGLLTEPYIDGIMIGEGEETFRELVQYYVETWKQGEEWTEKEEPVEQEKQVENVEIVKEKLAQNTDLIEEISLQTKTFCNFEETKQQNEKQLKFQQKKYSLYNIRGIAFKAQKESSIQGIASQNQAEGIIQTPVRPSMDMASVLFPYDDLTDFANKIIYYETSRGCPYRCSYCLSSIEKTVRLRPLPLVEKELQFFLDRNVPQVKFIDRTFNCNKEHSRFIWNYIHQHDNGITNFHFEISADLLEEEDFRILNKMRPGLVQLEIGVQSTNRKTIEAIHRKMDLKKLAYAVERVHAGKNIHQHLDLIAGLPWEDFASFGQSFHDVYAMRPDQLQLGFLKVLKGAAMEEDSRKYHIIYQEEAPYEVLKTDWLSYDEVLLLKDVEEMVEVYYNSGQFAYSIQFLEHYFPDAFSMYRSLAEYYEKCGHFDRKHTRLERFEILKLFFESRVLEQENKNIENMTEEKNAGFESGQKTAGDMPEQRKSAEFVSKQNASEKTERLKNAFCELLTCDVYRRENSKTRPGFAPNQDREKERFRLFYQKEDEERKYLKNYDGFRGRQLVTMTHMEHVSIDIEKTAQTGEIVERACDLLFDYREREPLHHQAKISIIEN
jgi:radical SAM superfamily enzyme YgiQ (UPF0313 family)